MSGAFYIGAVGLDAQQKALDTIANNISTAGSRALIWERVPSPAPAFARTLCS